jgi:RNA polymerase sigma-70 factor (ECF subfamily)
LTHEDEAEFTALVHRRSRFVFRVAYAVLLSAHDAEDVVQETFLKLYRNSGWKQQLESECGFLARVAWRVAVDRRRAQKPAAVVIQFDEHEEFPSPESSPEDAVVNANQTARVHRLIDTLPDELRLPLVFSAFEELNSREIASILNVPEGTVRTRLQRARAMLRQKFTASQTFAREANHG